MSLIEMANIHIQPQGLYQTPPPNPQGNLLHQSPFLPTAIQLGSNAPVTRAVQGVITVEQIEG